VWYRRPTAERLADEAFRSGRNAAEVGVRHEKRNREKSVGDSPPKKRGPEKVTPVNKECVIQCCVYSGCTRINEEDERTE
jgi:IMP dehydrogenase/GMP reductase